MPLSLSLSLDLGLFLCSDDAGTYCCCPGRHMHRDPSELLVALGPPRAVHSS
jgi:hypothetical protein